jgi:hypothetical protein
LRKKSFSTATGVSTIVRRLFAKIRVNEESRYYVNYRTELSSGSPLYADIP